MAVKKTRKGVRFTNAGREVVEVELTPEQIAAEAAAEQAKNPPPEIPPAGLSDAAALFVAQFGEPDQIITHTATIAGQAFNIEQLSGKEAVRLGAKRWRDAAGHLLDDADATLDRLIITAVQRCVVAVSEVDGKPKTTPFFSESQVEAMYSNPDSGARNAIDALWDEVLAYNPKLLPSSKN